MRVPAATTTTSVWASMGDMLTCEELIVGPSGIGEFSHLPDGSAGGISIDQTIVNRIGTETAFRSVEFGVRSLLYLQQRQVTSRRCYRAPFEALPPENDPAGAFTSLLTELAADPTELAELRARRGSVQDKVADDFNRLGAKVAAAERQNLECFGSTSRATATFIRCLRARWLS